MLFSLYLEISIIKYAFAPYGVKKSMEPYITIPGRHIKCRPGMVIDFGRLFAHDDDAPVAVVVGEGLHGVAEGLYGHAALVDALLL